MEGFGIGSARKMAEKEKIQHLMQRLVWLKEKTGKPSYEIVAKTLRRGKE